MQEKIPEIYLIKKYYIFFLKQKIQLLHTDTKVELDKVNINNHPLGA